MSLLLQRIQVEEKNSYKTLPILLKCSQLSICIFSMKVRSCWNWRRSCIINSCAWHTMMEILDSLIGAPVDEGEKLLHGWLPDRYLGTYPYLYQTSWQDVAFLYLCFPNRDSILYCKNEKLWHEYFLCVSQKQCQQVYKRTDLCELQPYYWNRGLGSLSLVDSQWRKAQHWGRSLNQILVLVHLGLFYFFIVFFIIL